MRNASLKSVLGVLALGLASTAAMGSTVSYGPVSYGPNATNWTSTLSLPKFNPDLGTLTGISFTLSGTVTGSAGVENTGAPADPAVDLTLKARIRLTTPGPSPVTLVTVFPLVETLGISLAGYDGITDFLGASGDTYSGLSGTLSDMGSSVDFALFTGSGSIALPISAQGQSFGSGGGNLTTAFTTNGEASASVTYTYTPVPMPAAAGMAGVAMAGVGMLSRRRRK